MEEFSWMLSLPALIGVGLLGTFLHFAKKNIKGETATEVRDFFRDNFKTTIVAIVTTVLGVVIFYGTLATGEAADLLSALMTGYTFDSIFNKWETSNSQTITKE